MNKIFVFIAGAAVGAAIMHAYLGSKYVMVTNSEWDELISDTRHKKNYRDEFEEAEKPEAYTADNNSEADKHAAEAAATSFFRHLHRLSDESSLRRISEAEFGEEDNYEEGTLFCYLDGVIADSSLEVFDIHGNIDDFLTENEKNGGVDCIFLRDDKRKIDYEILMVDSTFADRDGVGTS